MTFQNRRNAITRRTFATLVALVLSTFALSAQATDVGNLVTFAPNTPARAAEVNSNFDDVKTAVNSKQDAASAAGVDFVSSATSQSLQTQLSEVASVTVTVPAAGFVVVDFDTQTFINHVTGTTNGLSCRLERNGTFLRVRAYDVYAAEQTGGRNRPMHISYARNETAPGSVTYRARCSKAGTATAQVNNWTLSVKYFEHRY